MTGRGLVVAVLFMLAVSEAGAVSLPTVTCHCFTERRYDPSRPTAADAYFLASTQNSFFARLFGVDRKELVLKKQRGVSGDDLWISHGISRWSGVKPETLMEERKRRGGWSWAVTALGIDAGRLGERTRRELAAGGGDDRIARGVLDDILLSRHLVKPDELQLLRQGGTGNAEVILLLVISSRSGRKVTDLRRDVTGGASWGKLLTDAGMDREGLEREVGRLLPVR